LLTSGLRSLSRPDHSSKLAAWSTQTFHSPIFFSFRYVEGADTRTTRTSIHHCSPGGRRRFHDEARDLSVVPRIREWGPGTRDSIRLLRDEGVRTYVRGRAVRQEVLRRDDGSRSGSQVQDQSFQGQGPDHWPTIQDAVRLQLRGRTKSSHILDISKARKARAGQGGTKGNREGSGGFSSAPFAAWRVMVATRVATTRSRSLSRAGPRTARRLFRSRADRGARPRRRRPRGFQA